MNRAAVVLTSVLFAGPAYPLGSAPHALRVRPPVALVAMERDFTMTFPHRLGAARAHDRVTAGFNALRAKYGGLAQSSSMTWIDDKKAEFQVTALTQTARAWVNVDDTSVQIRVHLPLLLSPFSGKVQSILTDLANKSLYRKRG